MTIVAWAVLAVFAVALLVGPAVGWIASGDATYSGLYIGYAAGGLLGWALHKVFD